MVSFPTLFNWDLPQKDLLFCGTLIHPGTRDRRQMPNPLIVFVFLTNMLSFDFSHRSQAIFPITYNLQSKSHWLPISFPKGLGRRNPRRAGCFARLRVIAAFQRESCMRAARRWAGRARPPPQSLRVAAVGVLRKCSPGIKTRHGRTIRKANKTNDTQKNNKKTHWNLWIKGFWSTWQRFGKHWKAKDLQSSNLSQNRTDMSWLFKRPLGFG